MFYKVWEGFKKHILPKKVIQVKSTNYNHELYTDHIRNLLKKTYKVESLYTVNEEYTGYGISGDITVKKNDIISVIKKSDPCGNPLKWFVDNGCKKL